MRTPAESEIGNALRKSGAVQALGVKVDDVIADPRHSVVTVTFSMPAGANLTRESIIRGAAAIVKTAFDAHSAVNNVTARCVISSDMGTQIAFIGDASRSSIQGLPDNPTIEQMEQIFNNPWWNPNIK